MPDAAPDLVWNPCSHDRPLGLVQGLPPVQIEHRLKRATRGHAEETIRLCFFLVELKKSQGFRELGYSSLTHFAEASLRWGERKLQGMLRFASIIGRYTGIRDLFWKGLLCWTKVRELGRVLTPETQEAWARKAIRLTSRELEREVYRAAPERTPRHRMGNLMQEPDGQTVREVYFRVKPEEFKLLEDAATRMSREESEAISIPELIHRLTHDYLAGKTREGEARVPYTFVLYRCESCKKASVFDADGAVPVSEEVVARQEADAKVVRLETVEPPAEATHVGGSVAAHGPVAAAEPEGPGPSRHVPAATRTSVQLRSRGRCLVPGCRNRIWMHLHHVESWACRHHHDPDLLALLCSTCHGAVHDGRLRITRLPSGEFLITRRDGSIVLGGHLSGRLQGGKLAYFPVPRICVAPRGPP